MSCGTFNVNGCLESRASSQSNHSVIEIPNPPTQSLPLVAKYNPSTRLSLKKSKRGFRALFTSRKSRQDKGTSCGTKVNRGDSKFFNGRITLRPSKSISKSSKILTHAGDSLAQYFTDSDPPSDSSHECSSTLCEDVASLKSFDSLTGCGEIFADEENTDQLETVHHSNGVTERCEDKQTPSGGSFQGGGEQLASPAQTDSLDINGLWKNVDNSVISCKVTQQSTESKQDTKPYSSALESETQELFLSPLEFQNITEKEDIEESEKNLDASNDLGTPQSDHQESTSNSDEGYYDSFTPGQDEEESKDSHKSSVSSQFPRDSYSGDALYELFYDPTEPGMSPLLDEVSGMPNEVAPSTETPLSMHSFYVGAEENMAPSPTMDVINQEIFQGSWKGKECLLKLCNTELSLAMDLVNCLRQKSETNEFGVNLQTIENHGQTKTDLVSLRNMSAGQSGYCDETEGDHEDDGGTENLEKAISAEQIDETENNMEANNQNSASICEKLYPSTVINGDGWSSKSTPGYDIPELLVSNLNSKNAFLPISASEEHALRSKPHRELNSTTKGTAKKLETMIVMEINKAILCPKCRQSLESNYADVVLCSSCFAMVGHCKASDVSGRVRKNVNYSAPSMDQRNDSKSTPLQETDNYVSQLLENCVHRIASLKMSSRTNEQFSNAVATGDPFQGDFQNKEDKCIGTTAARPTENHLLNYDRTTWQMNEVLTEYTQRISEKNIEMSSSRSSGCTTVESPYRNATKHSNFGAHRSRSLNRKNKQKSVSKQPSRCHSATFLEAFNVTNRSGELHYEINTPASSRGACAKRNSRRTSLSENAYTPSRPCCLPLSKSVCSDLQNSYLTAENFKGCKMSLSHQGTLSLALSPSSPSVASVSRDNIFVLQATCSYIAPQEGFNCKERKKDFMKSKKSIN
eukprot:gi/632934319/ref/XP_007907625.1/ PREDICTED: APC membrane recruitment protein 3 [Callorhinchus milii]